MEEFLQKIEQSIDQLYEEFKGIPSGAPIVRNGQRNDAFELLVLKVLYGARYNLDFKKTNVAEISKYIPAPPDNGIDIFIEEQSGDDSRFDVIQVKYKEMSAVDIASSFSYMKETVKKFCKDPLKVQSISCREVLSNSNLDKTNIKNCKYYVVHTGQIHGQLSDNDDEIVLNLTDVQIVMQSKKDKVLKETIRLPKAQGYMKYNSGNSSQNAVVCSINCYDLAKLEDKYFSTEIGRNILFGHNLRESLKKSKSFDGMLKTIKTEPENFWYYNNGITIVADKVSLANTKNDVKVTIENFSIVNGAQTTSALGRICRDAERDKQDDVISALKEAYVIARVLEVNDANVQQSIAIYNNTQNPINSRDMVANNIEQTVLYDRLINDEYPQIYMEIRRGHHLPQTFNKLYAHRMTTNEELAQMAYAGYLMQPYIAKDKKASVFNPDYSQSDYPVNEIYYKVFNFDGNDSSKNGILQEKTKSEIDELLFAQQLYKECKTALRKVYQNRIISLEEDKNNSTPEKQAEIDRKIGIYTQRLDTIGVCMVYFVTTYYEFDMEFGKQFRNKRFEYERFYLDKNYKTAMVEEAMDFFLSITVDILIDTLNGTQKTTNMNNWVRSAACDSEYKTYISNMISSKLELEKNYISFMQKYKTIPIQ